MYLSASEVCYMGRYIKCSTFTFFIFFAQKMCLNMVCDNPLDHLPDERQVRDRSIIL